MENKLKVGDTIRCHDPADLVAHMNALENENIRTDFLYEKDGEHGYWLEITAIGPSKEETNMDTITTEFAEYICDKLCKHPGQTNTQEELDAICDKCMMANYICDILNEKR